MRNTVIIMIGCVLMCVVLSGCLENSQNAGWTYLVKDKIGSDKWIQRGDMKAIYTVKDGVLTGSTNNNRNNSFLCTARNYSDFILEFDFKLGDPDLNSGVQIRSLSTPSYKKGRVHGYQVEIDGSLTNKKPTNINADGSSAANQPRSWTGGIYDEARRGWLNDLSKNPAARKAYKRDQWNHLAIKAEGDSIKTWLNGVPAADMTDDMTAEGFIGFQVHGTGSDKKMQIKWKNIRIKTLK